MFNYISKKMQNKLLEKEIILCVNTKKLNNFLNEDPVDWENNDVAKVEQKCIEYYNNKIIHSKSC